MVPVGMLALAFTAATAVTFGGIEQAPGGGFYVDLLNLQWWQALIGIAVGLGLSPAPWITALATGRLLFRADMERQLNAKDAEHARAIERIDIEHARAMAEAKTNYETLRNIDKERYDEVKDALAANAIALEAQRSRSDEVTDGLLEVGDVLKANVHVLESFHGAASDIRAERES